MIATLQPDLPGGEIALVISVVAFFAVLVEVTLIRRKASLDHDLRIPLDDGRWVASTPKEEGPDVSA